MSNFYLDIDGPSHMDKYLQVKHEDTADDGPVLGVARVLDKQDSKVEAEKIVKRYNAYETLIEAIKAVRRTSDDVDICQSLERLLQRYDEAEIGEPTT
jgi:hypothetical protein